ncbi:MAG: CAP domain-containing protein [bacterium]
MRKNNKINIKALIMSSIIAMSTTNYAFASQTYAVIPDVLSNLFTDEELEGVQILPIGDIVDSIDEVYLTEAYENQENSLSQIEQIITTSQQNNEAQTVIKATIGSDTILVQEIEHDISSEVYLSNGNTMVPLRFICNALGVSNQNIIYNYYDNTIKVVTDNGNYEFTQGKNYVFKQDRTVMQLMYMHDEVVIETIDGTAFMPVKILQTMFGVELYWDNTNRTAVIIKKNKIPSVEVETDGNISSQENASGASSSYTPSVPEPQIVEITNFLSSEEKRELEKDLVELVNQERVKNNLQPLEVSDQLMGTAYYKAKDMAQNNYFSHTDLSGVTLASRLGIAENIGAGQMTASDVLANLLLSEDHKKNILDPNIRYIGVGYEEQNNSEYGYYWVQQFSSDDKWSNSVIKDNSIVDNILNNTTELAVMQNNNQAFITPSASITFLSDQEISSFEQQLFSLINQERSKQGLEPLILSSSLSNISRQKSDDMAYKNYLGHADKGGKILYQTIEGSAYPTITENYGAGTTSPSQLLNIWLSIDAQKEQILSPTNKYIGIAFTQNLGSDLKYYTSAHFSSNSKWQ